MRKTIEIPEGYEARIESNKVILEPKESEDEKIRKELLDYLMKFIPHHDSDLVRKSKVWIAWLEKQGSPKMSAEALREGIAHYGITQYQIDNWLKKYVEVESTEPPKYGIGDVIRLKNSDHEFIISRITGEYYHSKGAFIEIRIADDVNGDWEYVRHIQPKPKFNVGDTILAKPETCMEHVPFHITSIEDGFYWDGDDSILIDNQDDFVLVGKTVKEPAPKFKVGDWVVFLSSNTLQIVKIDLTSNYYWFNDGSFLAIVDEDCLRPWTIQDAKDGDVLSYRDGQWIFIYKVKNDDNSFFYHTLYSTIHQDLTIDDAAFTLLGDAIIPATKEQYNLLFQKIKEAGYEWDAEKKELRKIEHKHPDMVANLKEYLANTPKEQLEKDWDELKHWNNVGPTIEEFLYGKQNPAWSEEDEEMLNKCIEYSIRIVPVKPAEDSGLLVDFKKMPDEKAQDWLKSLKERYTWKPSDEQMIALKETCDKHWEPDGLDPLYTLYQDLEKLKG